ncbi:alpha/beta fold hydrolase [Algihabitans albus]|uniref:alpha/beta fold hydrolase n=1 Tax=Algihabitans albus TaxID=2164067 RepID=UPI0013C2C232|nr:alpha/beta hydrolase [Algihabitans albus]
MEINGTRLFVEDSGGDGPPVVFTHALFFSGRMYAAQVAGLKGGYRCITVDWRGMGRSAKPLGGYDVDNLARDVMALADALHLDRFHWVGMSVGGVTGLRNAAQNPNRILSLAVGGASAEAEPLEKLRRYETLLADYARDPASVLDRVAPILYGCRFREAPEHAEAYARERSLIVENDGPAVQRAAAPILRRVDIRHMLAHVRCPTTVFVGEEDGANGPEKAKVIAQGVPGAELHILRNVGHQPNVEAAEAVTALLLDHLSRASR